MNNMLKLNKDKTKLIVFSSKQHAKKTENHRIKGGSNHIYFSMSIRNLGFIFDHTLGMEKQINYKCKYSYYQKRSKQLIRKYIIYETCKTLV